MYKYAFHRWTATGRKNYRHTWRWDMVISEKENLGWNET